MDSPRIAAVVVPLVIGLRTGQRQGRAASLAIAVPLLGNRDARIESRAWRGLLRFLAKAGVVRSGRVTTHWEDQAELAAMFPALEVIDGARWVEQGKVVTSAGVSAGIDMSLHLVGRMTSVSLAEATAHQMDYLWNAGHGRAYVPLDTPASPG